MSKKREIKKIYTIANNDMNSLVMSIMKELYGSYSKEDNNWSNSEFFKYSKEKDVREYKKRVMLSESDFLILGYSEGDDTMPKDDMFNIIKAFTDHLRIKVVVLFAKDYREGSSLGQSFKAAGAYILDGTDTDKKEKLKKIIRGDISYEEVDVIQKREEQVKSYNKEYNIKETKNIVQKKIAVVGSQSRIGTTTLAMQMALGISFLFDTSTCYLECNSNLYVENLGKIVEKQGSHITLNGIDCFLEDDFYKDSKRENYEYIICDYAVLSSENINKIIDKDLIVLASGLKSNEFRNYSEAIKMLIDYNPFVVFNFVSNDMKKDVLRSQLALSEQTGFLEYTPDLSKFQNYDLITNIMKKVEEKSIIFGDKIRKYREV